MGTAVAPTHRIVPTHDLTAGATKMTDTPTAATAGRAGGTTSASAPVRISDAAIGPLFPASGSSHSCTAAVVNSAAKNLIITAAHCVSGNPLGMRFVPGYLNGSTPEGTWTVEAGYADQRWIQSQDPRFDYAFLRVANTNGRALEDVVRGFPMRTPAAPEQVEAVGYGAGQDDEPITCGADTHVYDAGSQGRYLEFDCPGFVDGTSGSPFLASGAVATGAIVGVIGGLHAGGCIDSISYSSTLDRNAFSLLVRAIAGQSSDVLPAARSDC